MDDEKEKEKENMEETNANKNKENDNDNFSQSLEKKHFYIMSTIASILFSILLAAINSSHLILFYVYEEQPFFPSGWNPWYNVIYVIAFYMLINSFIYLKSYQYSLKRPESKIHLKNTSEMIFVYIGLIVFTCSYALHVYTGWFILDFQPPNYISD